MFINNLKNMQIKLNPLPKPYPMPPTMWAGDGMAEGAEAGINTGVLHGIAAGAHIIGDDRDYQNVSLNKKKDYEDYVVTPPQPQSGNGSDSMGCTSHGFNRPIEAELTFMYHNGLLTEVAAKFLEDNHYFDVNGRVQADDRILVVESGTTEKGNYLDTVAETARVRVGLCPVLQTYDWSKYTRSDYFAINPEIRAKQLEIGKKFLEIFKIYHRWLLIGSSGAGAASVIDQYLEYGALYCASTTHSFAIIGLEGQTAKIYDSYNPYIRHTDLSKFPQLWVKQVVITEQAKKAIPFLPYYERKDGQSTIAVYDPATDMMVPISDGGTYKIVNAAYKNAKTVPDWIRPLDRSRLLTVTNV